MNIVDIYLRHVQQIVNPRDFEDHFRYGSVKLTMTQFDEIDRKFQFRFEIKIPGAFFPVAQYVMMDCNGMMTFRETGRWFVPIGNDVLFNRFSEARDYVKQLKWVE